LEKFSRLIFSRATFRFSFALRARELHFEVSLNIIELARGSLSIDALQRAAMNNRSAQGNLRREICQRQTVGKQADSYRF